MQGQLWNAGPVTPKTRGWRHGSRAGPCREPGCDNMARAAQGARYCETHSRSAGYNPLSGRTQTTCRKCNASYLRPHQSPKYSPAMQAWHEYCADCHRDSPLRARRLVHHRVPEALVHKWLEQGALLKCDLCHRRLGRKTAISMPSIDHDHECCRGERSCGQCIRGILCVRCNTLIGAYEQMRRVLDSEVVATYLHF